MADRTVSTEQVRVVERVLDVLADLVAERCAARLSIGNAAEYTSKDLPPGMSRATFVRRCRELANAGAPSVFRRGKLWVAKRDAIDQAPTRRRTHDAGPSETYSIDAALARAGARKVRQ